MGHDLAGPVLLTGASGYLGRRVLARLAARGVSCVPTSRGGRVGEACDLTNAAAARALLDRTGPSVVIHCAAEVPASPAGYQDARAADASVAMLKAVADGARCPIVLASSMTVYGAAPGCPVDEESAQHPLPGYATGKLAAEHALFERRRSDDVALRLPGLFGLPRRSGLLYKAATAFLTRHPFECTAPCGPWAAIAVDDAAEYLVRAAAMPSGRAAQAVNVGYEGEFSVLSAVAQVASACGVEWRPPAITVRPFSMRLERLGVRYGALAVTFRQRLEEFVDAVRHDLALEAAVRR